MSLRILSSVLILLTVNLIACKPGENDNNSSDESNKQEVTPKEDIFSAKSLSGEVYYPLERASDEEEKRKTLLRSAYNKFSEDNSNLENIIWYGRRLAYIDHYYEAIDVFSDALNIHPKSPELFRHRGHRYITTRRFYMAEEDLRQASILVKGRKIEIEPDGLPNKLNQPLSSLQFNIYYHLGLAYYLQGNYVKAATEWENCLKYSTNPDLLVATVDWLYLTYNHLGEKDKAAGILSKVKDNLEIIENESYYSRIKMYQGKISPEELLDLENPDSDLLNLVTQGYGVANYYKINGNEEKYFEILNKIIDTGYWTAFGFIAAEANLFRRG